MSTAKDEDETPRAELPKRGGDVGDTSFRRLLREREEMAHRCAQRARRPVRRDQDTDAEQEAGGGYVKEKSKHVEH